MNKEVVVLKEKCISLANSTGISNIVHVQNLENCRESKGKLFVLQKLYRLLKKYKVIVEQVRNKPLSLWSKEYNSVLKKLEEAYNIRTKICECINSL